MARIKKYSPTIDPHLKYYETFVVDTAPNSRYFKITEFKDTFTGGKNGFLIEGSPQLLESTEIKIEILDVEGNPIYFEPGNGIPEYYEGNSKVIAVYVYEDTPIGTADITILGELKQYYDGVQLKDIPDEWKGIYNVKWQRDFKVNKLLSNEEKVRFYKRPTITITEIVKPLFTTILQPTVLNGFVKGTAIAPPLETYLKDWTLPTYYKLTAENDGYNPSVFFTGSMVGTKLNFSHQVYDDIKNFNLPYTDPTYAAVNSYSPTVVEVLNSTEILVTQPFTINNKYGNPLVYPLPLLFPKNPVPYDYDGDGTNDLIGFTQQAFGAPFTASFIDTKNIINIASALTGSFAKIDIRELTTFTGDVARVRIFRKSQSDVGNYEFTQEVLLESNELLVDYTVETKNQENYGIFTEPIITEYWDASAGLTTTFNQDYLYDSVELDAGSVPKYFSTKDTFTLNEGKEYALSFNIRKNGIDDTSYLRAFISGSRQVTTNGVTKTIQIQQDFVKIYTDPIVLQKATSTNNIKVQQIDNAKLYFEVRGINWYIANVSLVAAQETAFSPDEITFIQSVPRTLTAETFDYRFEFYDINNNYIPVKVETQKLFTGGNLQAIKKGIFFNPKILTFTFDSASHPVPPTTQSFNVEKFLITGSITYTSQSYDYNGNLLSGLDYLTAEGMPGLLDLFDSGSASDIDNPSMTVNHFTGSNPDKTVQLIKITGTTEGYSDTVTYVRILDGFGGVNHLIRPYRGTQIRNSSTQSLEVQAIRIDGINDIELSAASRPDKKWNLIQLHVLSGSQPYQKFINLEKANSSGFVQGLSVGELGSKELNFNAVFNRDSINKRITVYMIDSASAAYDWAYNTSGSVLASQILEDLQDGLDSGIVKFNADTFNIDFRNSLLFAPPSASATASFYIRGSNTQTVTASFQVFPSMSINDWYEPEYWIYYTTQSVNSTISVTAIDEKKNVVNAGAIGSYIGANNKQSKNLTLTFTYTEPYTNATANIDKTFTIVQSGKPGDEAIIFEVTPANVILNANSKGTVLDYKPSITDIKLKQGSRYLLFTASAGNPGKGNDGTFHIAQNQITSININSGSVYFNTSYTSSLSASAASNFVQLSGSITYPLIIHPYYTSSIYTASVVQQFTKAVDGAPPIQVIINPANVNLGADQIGIVKDYNQANTIIKLKEGTDYLVYTNTQQPGTFRTSSVTQTNISVSTLTADPSDTTNLIVSGYSAMNSNSASIQYNFDVYPYSLLPGHRTGSIAVSGSQYFTRTKDGQTARSVTLTANSLVISFDGDSSNPDPGTITLTAKSFGVTGSAYYQFFKDGISLGAPLTGTTKNLNSSYLPIANAKSIYKVELRDGSATLPVAATAEITIAGVKAGGDGYTVTLTNENTSIVYKVSGATTTTGTGTSILASKGTTALQHVSSFNNQTYDNDGTYIGSLGQYKVTIDSKSGWLALAGSLVSGSTVPTVSNVAVLGDLSGYTSPNLYPTANIVFKVDVEDGRAVYYKTESIAVQYEGNTGPGIVMRGVYKNTINYIGSVETTNYRRDAVIYPDPTTVPGGTVTYYAAVSGSGPGLATGAHAPNAGGNNDWWQLLGDQEFFVSAKIAIFDESYVKNTLNVGTYADTSEFVNVIIAGGRTDPYIAVGQSGTYGTAGGGYSPNNPAIIGYGQSGIYMGIYENGSFGTTGRFSIVNEGTASTSGLYWDGSVLTIKGAIKQTDAGVNEPTLKGVWSSGITYYNNDVVSYGGKSWICTSAVSHFSTNDTNATTGYPGSGPWNTYIDKGDTGAGVVYRGPFTIGTAYSSSAVRKDVVQGIDGAYYLSKLTYIPANTDSRPGVGQTAPAGSTAGTYWQTFGATFSSVATDILLAQEATITRGLVMGSDAGGIGVIRSSNAYSFTSGSGFYMDRTGIVRFGNPVGNQIKFDGTSFQITGSINATDGQIGEWIIDTPTNGGVLRDNDSQLIFDPNVPEIQFYTGSGAGRSKKVSISPLRALSDPGIGSSTLNFTGSYSPANPSITTNTGNVSAVTVNSYSVRTSTGGASSNGTFTPPEVGTFELTVVTPSFRVETPPDTVSHTTDAPDFDVPNDGYIHTGFSEPQTAAALLYIEAVKASDGSVVGSTYIGASNGVGAKNVGSQWIGYLGYLSVTGDTLIIDEFGNEVYARDIISGQNITAWNWSDSFSTYKVENVRNRTVDKVFKISAGGKEVKVSDSHGFWLDGNEQIKAKDLIPGVSKINIKDDNTIKLVIVDDVEIMEGDEMVYTFSVPGVNNYISNGIISHNPAMVDEGTWSPVGPSVSSAYTDSYIGFTEKINIYISEATPVQFRYRFYYFARSGNAADLGAAANSYTNTYYPWTFDAWTTSPSFASSIEIKSPSNFVEINAGGMQVVSDATRYVAMPRREAGVGVSDLLKVLGGNIKTDTILPNVADISTIGTYANQYGHVYANNFTNNVSDISGANNYTKLTNGVLLQWGYATGTSALYTITFPIAFPTACRSVHITTDRNTSGANGYNHATSVTTTSFSAVFDQDYDGWWMAIGV
jgi:hypothetical protein